MRSWAVSKVRAEIDVRATNKRHGAEVAKVVKLIDGEEYVARSHGLSTWHSSCPLVGVGLNDGEEYVKLFLENEANQARGSSY